MEIVKEKVNTILQDYFEIPTSQLVESACIQNDLKLDSLDAVDLLVHLEDKIGIRVDPDEFQAVKTLGDIYEIIHKLDIVPEKKAL